MTDTTIDGLDEDDFDYLYTKSALDSKYDGQSKNLIQEIINVISRASVNKFNKTQLINEIEDEFNHNQIKEKELEEKIIRDKQLKEFENDHKVKLMKCRINLIWQLVLK